MQEIIDFNLQQLTHIQFVQRLVHQFCSNLTMEAIGHDTTKFSNAEYDTFVNSRKSLNESKDGKDENYQKFLNSQGIQHHITQNRHHPEYWDAIGQEMPLDQIIIMFFDWKSRSIQRGTNFADFLPFNLEKLKNQPKARVVVELLMAMPEGAMVLTHV